MTHRRPIRLVAALPAALLGGALLAGAAAAALSVPAEAQERPQLEEPEPVADQVRRLLDETMSDDARVRERAEREIVALGDPARAELDRLTRDTDPKRAIAALKLLQSDAWERRERRVAREEREKERGIRMPEIDLRDFQEQVERQMEEMRRRMSEWEKEIDWDSWMPRVDATDPLPSGGRSSGTVVEDGRQFSWSIDETGKVRITVRDGKDAPEKVYEAPNVEALRKEHPDVAARLDGLVPQGGAHRFVFRWPPRLRGVEPAQKGAPQEREPGDANRPPLRDGEERLRPRADGELPPAPNGEPLGAGPRLGVLTAPVPDVLREQLDVPEGGMVVESVVPNSLAEKLGLRRNDVLLRVAGREVASPPDVRKALEAVADGGAVEVEILRKGRREKLSAAK